MSDEVQGYNRIARAFHWSIAVLIIGLLVVGFYMEGMEPAPFKYKVYGWHKALGITVLVLAVLRIVWRQFSPRPQSLSHYKQWEKILSKTIHAVLYVAMIGMPLSGWVMSSAGGYPVSFFGLFDVPSIVSKDKELSRLANELHGIFGYAIVGVVVLHIFGALKHHIIDKDATLSRMGGYLIYGVLGLIALGLALAFPAQRFLEKAAQKNAVIESVHESKAIIAE